MDIFTAIILGLVQGITEFFPVSSSAHLRLAKWLLKVPDGEHLLYFDLLCHSGTLIALILYLRRSIWEVLCRPRMVALFAIALLPLLPAYFLLKPLRIAASEPRFLGWALLMTSAILFCAGRVSGAGSFVIHTGLQRAMALCRGIRSGAPSVDFAAVHDRVLYKRKWLDVLCIGAAQTVALIPGISRSGSTIAMARWLGWDWVEAARFSFLLAIPAVLGGQLLETLKLLREDKALYGLPWEVYAAGFTTSFFVGLFSVRLIFWTYERGTVNPFAWYCLGMGLFVIWNFYG